MIYESITELPFLASNSGDHLLSQIVGSARGRQRLRATCLDVLDLKGSRHVSFGPYGSTRLVPTAVLTLSAVSSYTPSVKEKFIRLLKRYVLASRRSTKFEATMLPQLTQFLKDNPPEQARWSLACGVNRRVSEWTLGSQYMLLHAQKERDFWCVFSEKEEIFERLPAQLVRFEGDEALITVWDRRKKDEELRTIDATLLRDSGVLEEGDTFVLHEFGSPGVRVSLPVPAISLDHSARNFAAEDAELDAYETPFPRIGEDGYVESGVSSRSGQKAGG